MQRFYPSQIKVQFWFTIVTYVDLVMLLALVVMAAK